MRNVKTESDLVKKVFTVQKMQLIDENKNEIIKLQMEAKLARMAMNNHATREDMDKLDKKIETFTPL